MACTRTHQTRQYYDAELPIDQRADFEAHLAACEACRRELDELKAVSSILAEARPAEMPPGLRERLYASGKSVSERGVLRLAGWLTGAAAAVLVGGLLNWHSHNDGASMPGATWATVAVMPTAEVQTETSSELVVAQWMADDLSSLEEGELR